MRSLLAFSMSFASLALCGLGLCQESHTRVSGLEAGRALPAVRVYAPVGRNAGKEFDVTARVGEDACALLFIHELTRNTAPVIRGLDGLARKRALLGFRYVPILLSADRTAAEKRLEAVNRSLRLANPIVLSVDGAEGPGALALNRTCTLTIVFAKAGKVLRSVGLTDTGRQDLPKLEAWVTEACGALPATPAEWRARVAARLPSGEAAVRSLLVDALLAKHAAEEALRSVRHELRKSAGKLRRLERSRGGKRDRSAARRGGQAMRRPASRRAGKAPTDATLRELLRAFISKLNSADKADDLYLEITTHAAGKPDLAAQVDDMFRLILSLDYGTEHARSLAKKHLTHARKHR